MSDTKYCEEDLNEMIQVLDMIIEDLPSKAKDRLDIILKELRSNPNCEDLFKIQGNLEIVSTMSNIDNFSRNELINVISGIESFINS